MPVVTDEAMLEGFLTTFVLLARDQFKPTEMVRHHGAQRHTSANGHITELDPDQSLLWVCEAVSRLHHELTCASSSYLGFGELWRIHAILAPLPQTRQ